MKTCCKGRLERSIRLPGTLIPVLTPAINRAWLFNPEPTATANPTLAVGSGLKDSPP